MINIRLYGFVVCFALVSGWAFPAGAQVTAQTLVGKAVSDDSSSVEITNAIGRFVERDIDGCQAVLERAKSNNSKLPPPGVMMATLWLSANQIGLARGELESAVLKFPEDPEPYLMLGDLAFQERRATESSVLFDRARLLTASFKENANRKRDFEIRCAAGVAAVAEARKQWEVAQANLVRWLEFDPESVGAHQRLGFVLFQLKKPKEALDQFREAKKLDGKAIQPELAMARLYEEASNRDTANKLIEAAVRAAPKDLDVLLAASQWYLGQNDLENSKRIADDVLKIDPKNIDAKVIRGVIARVARDYATAERFFSDAHAQSPGNFAASNSLALVLIESADSEFQRRALEMAESNVAMYRESSPQQVNALTTLSWVYYKLGRREDAERILAQITQNNLLTTDGAYYVSKLLVERGERDRPRKILEDVLASAPVFATRSDAQDLLDKLKKD